MIGAILGDVAGSIYEFDNTDKLPAKETLWTDDNCATDDSQMTLALAKALCEIKNPNELYEAAIRNYREVGLRFPDAGWGQMFDAWIVSDTPMPYGSWGNGAAMRVSPVAYYAKSEMECRQLARIATVVTHNAEEAMKWAEKAALACYYGLHCQDSRERIKGMLDEAELVSDVSTLRQKEFNLRCSSTVITAINVFLLTSSFEEAVQVAISLGGDSDTIACVTGAIAAACYGVSKEMRETARRYCVPDLFQYVEKLQDGCVGQR